MMPRVWRRTDSPRRHDAIKSIKYLKIWNTLPQPWSPKKSPRPKFSYIMTTWQSPRKYATWFLPVHGDTPENKIDRFKTHPVQTITVLNSPSFCLPKGDDPRKPPLLKLPLSPSGKPLNNREENQTKNISIMAGQLVLSPRRWCQMPT